MLRRAALRGDHRVRALVLHPHQRRLADLPALRAPGGQHDHRQPGVAQRGPLRPARTLVQLDLLAHPLLRARLVLTLERHRFSPLRRSNGWSVTRLQHRMPGESSVPCFPAADAPTPAGMTTRTRSLPTG
ncbi:hypothetical protein SGPA1_40784 [Streptomyces misionensis JCM 4497]